MLIVAGARDGARRAGHASARPRATAGGGGRPALLVGRRLPAVRGDGRRRRPAPMHHPFTMPHPDDIDRLESDPLSVRAQAYDLVLNGWELGSGSVRIHRPDVQQRIFSMIGIDADDAQQRFGFLLDAFRFGAPPHAGFAVGIDRFVAILAGEENIREVIAFPKTQSGVDPLTGAPTSIDPTQLRDLGLRLLTQPLQTPPTVRKGHGAGFLPTVGAEIGRGHRFSVPTDGCLTRVLRFARWRHSSHDSNPSSRRSTAWSRSTSFGPASSPTSKRGSWSIRRSCAGFVHASSASSARGIHGSAASSRSCSRWTVRSPRTRPRLGCGTFEPRPEDRYEITIGRRTFEARCEESIHRSGTLGDDDVSTPRRHRLHLVRANALRLHDPT